MYYVSDPALSTSGALSPNPHNRSQGGCCWSPASADEEANLGYLVQSHRAEPQILSGHGRLCPNRYTVSVESSMQQEWSLER